MCPEESNIQINWQLDKLIMEYWEAKTKAEKKHIELECYKLFKSAGFDEGMISYLKENQCDDLADELQHFEQIYKKVPHEHEKRLAA
ncbi:MAG: hypothetical protein K940chlam7_00865 [Chlamydiae bacterium]|nr:hypothetical protein [Chlamydiota bacterium]